jgi:glycosyltransferase involved in cell wall biosynthesis
MNKPTIWIFSLEPLESRNTQQWHSHVPLLLKNKLGDRFNVVQVDGVQKNSQLTPGAFLNFSDTNYWKSAQMCAFLEQHNQGKTSPTDHFIFTDAWNPTVIQLKYMSDLLGFNWTLHGLWHAGSYDSQDFLGRLVGDEPWVRHAEKSFFWAFDHNYFATDFHINMFVTNLLNNGFNVGEWKQEDVDNLKKSGRIVRTGWPMEYMENALVEYKNMEKRDLILFPHRIAPEKQVEIFRDLKEHLPQYEFVVCQDQYLTKNEYHNLLGEAKLVFSANLQETLGISCYEGAVVDAIPMVPDRLSYSEMYYSAFKYPSEWTESFESYEKNRTAICHRINQYMDNYNQLKATVRKQTSDLTKQFFSCNVLLKMLK